MILLDPSTGQPLPPDAIQRILFLAHPLHVYAIPPLTSIRGHAASSWTADPSRHIFTARLRVIETACPDSPLRVDIVLEDPATGQLFAAAPYTDPADVEPVLDSSRFFAVRVRDPAGRKATLGIGFEERSDAFDLAVVLQGVRRVLGLDHGGEERNKEGKDKDRNKIKGGADDAERDYSLKEGETITVNIGKKMGRRGRTGRPEEEDREASRPLQSFALPPPPPPPGESASAVGKKVLGMLPPPPSAGEAKREGRSLQDMGFDDGQFGEFS